MSPDSTDRAVREGDFCVGAVAVAYRLMDGPRRCVSDPGAVDVAIGGEQEIARRKGDVIFDTEAAEFATIPAEGRAKQTDWELVGLIWLCSLV